MRLSVDHLFATGRIKAPLMKSVNGIGLLNLIREHGPVSRASLAKISRLSKPTVSAQVEELIRKGLVAEGGQGRSGVRGGKKPTLVEFNADYARLLAVEIGPVRIRSALADLEGTIHARQSCPTEPAGGADAVIQRLKGLVRATLAQEAASTAKVKVISVAAPGRVDVRRGIVLDSDSVFNWHHIPVRQALEEEFGLPVLVDNDVNLAALGELNNGAARGERNVVLLKLGTGIGAGVVIGGKLHHGSNWAAGEVGHWVYNLGGSRRDWGSRGYLESVVGADKLAERLACGPDDLPAMLAAAHGDGKTREDVVLHLGLTVAQIAMAYDPGLIVLLGELFGLLFDEIKQVAQDIVPWPVRVCLSALGEEAVIGGAVCAGRSEAYSRIARVLNEENQAGKGSLAPDNSRNEISIGLEVSA